MKEPIIDREGVAGRDFGARTAVIDVDAGSNGLRLDEADRLYAAICTSNELCAYPVIQSPGPGASPQLVEAVVDRHADLHRRRAALRERLVARLGGAEPPPAALSISVVVCTHRRPDLLGGCLEAIAALDPPPHEVIVIDNRPGHSSARAVAERFGARYAVEERGGQNAARRLGVELATGEAVAFTDDDCRPAPGWLRRAGEVLADPSVAAVCGPAIAASVTLPEQEERERVLPFPALHRETRFDLANLPAVVGGAIGCGANLIVRRTAIDASCLPDDLEGGTPARSGGDLYLLYRLLRAGHEIVHVPQSWVAHDHAAGPGAAEATARGYGTGFAAFLAKVLVEERELSAPAAWTWLLRRWCSAVLLNIVAPDSRGLAIKRSYLAGGLAGPAAWRRARRAVSPPFAAQRTAAANAGPVAGTAAVEVVALEGSAARNAAARASGAELLLFLAPGAQGARDLAARHEAAHRAAGGGRIVAGVEEVRAADGAGLAAFWAAARSTRRSHLAATALAPTVDAVPDSNLSIARADFLSLGGYDERLSGRAAAHELAWRALDAGLAIEHVPDARTIRLSAESTGDLLAAAREAGAQRALASRERPELAAGVELRGARDFALAPTLARRVGIVAAQALRPAASTPFAVALARALERARQRTLWVHFVKVAERGAFAAGWRAGGGPAPPAPIAVDLAGSEPLEPPRVTARLEIRLRGRVLGTVTPRLGIWHSRIADQVLELLGPDELAQLAAPGADGRAPAAGALAGCAVALDPRADAAAFEALGAEVHLVAHAPAPLRWRAAARALAASGRDFLAAPLGDTEVEPRWLEEALAVVSAADVAVVMGGGIRDGAPKSPAFVERARPGRLPYRFGSSAPRFVVVARRHLGAIGGLDPDVGAAGNPAPALDLAERAVAAGLAVVCIDVHGVAPVTSGEVERRRAARERSRAIAALQAREARRSGSATVLAARLALPWLAGPLPRPFRIAHSPRVGDWLRDGIDAARGAWRGWRA